MFSHKYLSSVYKACDTIYTPETKGKSCKKKWVVRLSNAVKKTKRMRPDKELVGVMKEGYH